jgi:hypothetical protein
MTVAYPLAWPEGWPRTPLAARKDGRKNFGRFEQASGQTWQSKRSLTFREARESLYAALRKIGAREVVLSTNFQLNLAGEPRGDRRRPEDQAVAIYFKRKSRNLVMARDAFDRAEENMRSLALALEALATLERHGGDLMTEKAFTGFAALPPPPSCWEILELDASSATAAAVEAAFRRKARDHHPDAGGSDAAFKSLSEAKADALRRLGAGQQGRVAHG